MESNTLITIEQIRKIDMAAKMELNSKTDPNYRAFYELMKKRKEIAISCLDDVTKYSVLEQFNEEIKKVLYL